MKTIYKIEYSKGFWDETERRFIGGERFSFCDYTQQKFREVYW